MSVVCSERTVAKGHFWLQYEKYVYIPLVKRISSISNRRYSYAAKPLITQMNIVKAKIDTYRYKIEHISKDESKTMALECLEEIRKLQLPNFRTKNNLLKLFKKLFGFPYKIIRKIIKCQNEIKWMRENQMILDARIEALQ